MRTAAILPVKRFASAKSRLGEAVADELRGRLARAMVADVLQALAECSTLETTIVVSNEPSLPETARAHGALSIEDSAEQGQSAAVSLGIQRAMADGFERVLCVPGDCPALDPVELYALLADSPSIGGSLVIIPDRHGTGTNGLLLAPPDAISPSFGPGSCERHRELAREAGVACRVEQPSSLLLDIDTGADLAALRERLAGANAGALRTRAVLSQPENTEVITDNSVG
ncbi:MAG TPA: 2-phospho-L-lactate guanylyltransferase [Solirubrobacteraceae bacterium]|nr:2-phospho-L-lactate guanylyltransferase [Solirubrobacteraceae bacterium]